MLTIALLTALGAQDNFEKLWQETRAQCKDKPYVHVSLAGGGKGGIFQTVAYLSQDGKSFIWSRKEDPASWHGGSTRLPLIVVTNQVMFFDGKELTIYDALTGKTDKTFAAEANPNSFRGLKLFWLDKRQEGEWKIIRVEETDFGGASPTRIRLFTLTSPLEDNDIVITVRNRDGFVIDDYWISKKPEPMVQGGGAAGQKVYYEGSFLDQEPRELNWKPPTRG